MTNFSCLPIIKTEQFIIDFGLAPAEPLILKDVIFDFEFSYDENQIEKLNKFQEKLISSISHG